jgi:hypothetical protein
MKGKAHIIAAVVFLLLLAYDLFLWGGLSRTGSLGPLITERSQREVSLASFYLPVGRQLTGLVGAASAAGMAQATFDALEPRLLANPAAAMDTLLTGLPLLPRLGYYGAPLALLACLFLWWRRPRGVHMMGSRR